MVSERRKQRAGSGRPERFRAVGVLTGLVVGGLGVVAVMMANAGTFAALDLPWSSDGAAVHGVPETEKDLDEYWTEERMRNTEGL